MGTHFTNQKKDFWKAMTSLAQYILKEENSLFIIKEHIKLIGEQAIVVTLELGTLYDLCDLVEAPAIIKFKRVDCWNKAIKFLSQELLEIIHQRITFPEETKELLKNLQIFLIKGWTFPKLYLPLFNKHVGNEEVQALYKGLVQVISVDPFPHYKCSLQ